MEVREYRPEDSASAKDLILTVLKAEYPFDRSAYRDTDINDISGTYSGKGNTFFVVTEGARVIGTVGVKQDTRDSALLRRLFVDQNYRKKGIGTKLLEKAITFCKTEHYKSMIFRATGRMKSAMQLCAKMGFKEQEDLEVSGFHIHRFELKLSK